MMSMRSSERSTARLDIKSQLGAADADRQCRRAGRPYRSAVATGISAFGNAAVVTPISDGAKYWDVMPSLNLSVALPARLGDPPRSRARSHASAHGFDAPGVRHTALCLTCWRV